MKITAPRQNWILLSTATLIAIIFSIYFLVYVKGKEKQITENNFRVLHQIVQNIHSLRSGYEKNAETLANEMEKDLAFDDDPCKSIKEIIHQKAVSKEIESVCVENERGLSDSLFSKRKLTSFFGQQGLYFKGTKDVFLKTEYGQFFSNPLVRRVDIFNHIIVTRCGAGDENKTETNGNKLLYTNGRFGMLKTEFYDSIQKVSRFEIELNNSDYIVFNQKFDEEQNIYLSCLVLKSIFNKQKRSVSPFTIAFLSIALLLIILAMPLLKLQIMNIQEQLQIRDIVFSIASVLIGPAVFMVFVYTLMVFWSGKNIPDSVRDNLEKLSFRLEHNFNEEIEAIANQMDDLKVKYFHEAPQSDAILQELVDAQKMNRLLGSDLKYFPGGNKHKDYYMGADALDSTEHWEFKHFNYIFWADKRSRSRIQLSTFSSPSYGQDLSHRKYLNNIIENKPITFTGKKKTYPIAIESIKSVNDGTYEVGIGMPTDCNGCMLPVIATSAKLSSVMDVVLEEGYGFCILDKEGNTMFHSNKIKNLNENFIEETQGAFNNVIGVGTDEFETVNYNGNKQVVYLRPLQSLPDHYIATFVNTQVFYSGFTLAVISAFTLFVCYILLIFILFALIFALTYKSVKLKQMVYGLSFTKPFETACHLNYYKRLIAVMGIVIVYLALTAVIQGDNHDFLLGELILINGAMLIFTFITLARILPPQEIIHNIFKKNPGSTIYPVVFGIIGFAIFRVVDLLISSDTALGINALVGTCVIIFAAILCIFTKPQEVKETEILVSPLDAGNLQSKFRLFLFLLVIIFSIIPINVFLNICLTKEDEIQAKYRSMELIKNAESWMVAYKKDFQGNFSEHGELEFLKSMKNRNTYIAVISGSFTPDKIILRDSIESIFNEAISQGIIGLSDKDRREIIYLSDTIDKVLAADVFSKIYKQIRPDYNERAKQTSYYISSTATNPVWLYYKNAGLNFFDMIGYQDQDIVINRVIVPFSNFFVQNLMSIFFTIAISFIILFSFLRFILNKVYGFHLKGLAISAKLFRSARFPDIFLDKTNFSLNNSYNNIFMVGVSVAHKSFIKDYFQSQKDRHLFVFDLDNFYLMDWEKTTDVLKTYRDLIVIRHFPRAEKAGDMTWDKFIIARDKLTPPVYVLFDHFEYGYNDIRANKLKLHLLKDLVDSNRYTVIVKSEINATKLLNFYSESISSIENMLEDKNASNRMDLIAKRDDLMVDYKKWQHIFGSFVKVIIPIDIVTGDNELKYGEFMGLMQKYLAKAGLNELDEEDRVITIQQMSYPHYYSVWNALSKAEKYLVYDMAKDRFVNTVNINGIISLLSKGIFVYDHSLRLMNESFTNFVLTTVSSEEALAMEMEAKEKGSWNTAFPVILLIIVSLVIFLSIGQQSFLNDLYAYLTSIAALVGLLIRFSGMLTFGNRISPV